MFYNQNTIPVRLRFFRKLKSTPIVCLVYIRPEKLEISKSFSLFNNGLNINTLTDFIIIKSHMNYKLI